MAIILMSAFQCERCHHKWLPRFKDVDPKHQPQVCPKCKSPYWNKPRQIQIAPEKHAAVQGQPEAPLPTAPSPKGRAAKNGSRPKTQRSDTS